MQDLIPKNMSNEKFEEELNKLSGNDKAVETYEKEISSISHHIIIINYFDIILKVLLGVVITLMVISNYQLKYIIISLVSLILNILLTKIYSSEEILLEVCKVALTGRLYELAFKIGKSPLNKESTSRQ